MVASVVTVLPLMEITPPSAEQAAYTTPLSAYTPVGLPHCAGVASVVTVVPLMEITPPEHAAYRTPAALSAYTPERATPDAGLVRLWALRALALLVPAVVAWAAVSLTGGGLWLVGAVLVLAAVVAVTAVVSESAPS